MDIARPALDWKNGLPARKGRLALQELIDLLLKLYILRHHRRGPRSLEAGLIHHDDRRCVSPWAMSSLVRVGSTAQSWAWDKNPGREKGFQERF